MARLPINIAYLRSPLTNRSLTILIGIIVLFFVILLLMNPPKVHYFNRAKVHEGQMCYSLSKNPDKIGYFEDITESGPKVNSAIFFHQTSCGIDGLARLHVR